MAEEDAKHNARLEQELNRARTELLDLQLINALLRDDQRDLANDLHAARSEIAELRKTAVAKQDARNSPQLGDKRRLDMDDEAHVNVCTPERSRQRRLIPSELDPTPAGAFRRSRRHAIPVHFEPRNCSQPLPIASSKYPLKRIKSLKALEWELPRIVKGILTATGWQETDYVLSRCLQIELRAAGVKCLQLEQNDTTRLRYRGKYVGSKRNSFRVVVGKEETVIDFKAVDVWLEQRQGDTTEPFLLGISPTVDFPETAYLVSSIENLTTLHQELPIISDGILDVLGIHERESTYQSCLRIELERANVTVEEEKKIPLSYKGLPVGHRRADLVIKLRSGERAVIEIKSISTDIDETHVAQLHYYMNALLIENGFLINFPQELKFGESVFCESFNVACIQGDLSGGELIPPMFGTLSDDDVATTVVRTHMAGKWYRMQSL
mmetsp:Transcript_30033/g.49613  ORF Transcript_30033/g.49613 Transcript_30033/m.49613 type:complete len:439 (+) Transcript_30033:139-1455(+)